MSVRLSQRRYRCAATVVGALCLMLSTSVAFADPVNVIFTIDPTQSTDTWSGTDNTYGAFSAPVGGTLSTPVSGNFVVSFDPTTDNPTSIQVVGSGPNNNNGYYQLANSVASAVPDGSPANLSGTTSGGQVQFALRNLIFNLNSPTISASGTSGLSETFAGTTTGFVVTSGGIAATVLGNPVSGTYVGSTGTLTTGQWTLTESAPGSGQWTLGLQSTYTYATSNGTTKGTLTATGDFVATAQYSSSNVATTPGGSQTVTVPGSNPNQAVTATLPSTSSAGTLTVQQVPGITSLTQAAVTAGQNNPIFALSTSNTSIGAPQIWQVDYSGSLNGGIASLTFDFDPTTIPQGTPLADLGIWHYNETLGVWQFLTGPIVDSYASLGYDTISVQTGSFSPFFLGAPAPEPSSLMLAATGLLPLAGFFRNRRRRAA
jgi:hypothetical protein